MLGASAPSGTDSSREGQFVSRKHREKPTVAPSCGKVWMEYLESVNCSIRRILKRSLALQTALARLENQE